jgi:hypothetical protein
MAKSKARMINGKRKQPIPTCGVIRHVLNPKTNVYEQVTHTGNATMVGYHKGCSGGVPKWTDRRPDPKAKVIETEASVVE